MNVPLLDLRAQYQQIRSDVERAVMEVLASQQFILGSTVEACEQRVAAYCGVEHGVGVSSGSDALLMCLMAEGIGPGDEVITTPYTFFATVGAIARVGATPVFVDIDPRTYNIDVDQVASHLSARTKAIVPVHLYGQAADMTRLVEMVPRDTCVVIEDAAQAIGGEIDGRRCGSFGDYGCLSFFPSKNLGAAGDAGMIVTRDARKAERLKLVRSHGSKPKYIHHVVGGNFRLDALQAAIVNTKLPYLDEWTDRRGMNARRYNTLFAASGLRVCESSALASSPAWTSGHAQVVVPSAGAGRHVFNQYVIRVQRRDALQAFLKDHGVGSEVYYPVPMHLQRCFESLGHELGAFQESEAAARETLALPVYPELTDEQAAYVVGQVRDFFESEA